MQDRYRQTGRTTRQIQQEPRYAPDTAGAALMETPYTYRETVATEPVSIVSYDEGYDFAEPRPILRQVRDPYGSVMDAAQIVRLLNELQKPVRELTLRALEAETIFADGAPKFRNYHLGIVIGQTGFTVPVQMDYRRYIAACQEGDLQELLRAMFHRALYSSISNMFARDFGRVFSDWREVPA